MRKLVGSVSLLVLLAGCAGPFIQTARVEPVQPAGTWQIDAGPTAAIDARWWQGFGDPVLAALVERALANNDDIGIAVARVRQARAQEKIVHGQLLPSIDAGLGAATSRSVSAFATPLVQTAAEPQIQVSYEIDLFGRVANQASAAHHSYLASQAARDATRLAVAAAAASGYIALLGLDARLAVAKQTLAVRDESLRLARSRSGAGYSPMLEQRQAEAERAATAQIVAQIELAVSRQENALSVLAGDVPSAIARGKGLASLAEPPIPSGLPSELLRRRPDIAEAELQLAAADDSLAAARKRFLPQIQLTGAAGAAFSTLLANPISLFSIGGSILAPLFEGGRLKAEAEGAGAQRDAAAFIYRRTVLNAFREVDDGLAGAVRLDEQERLVETQRDALSAALRLAVNRYRAGYATYLEQLDAQRGLLSTELTLAQVHADLLLNRVALFQAMGGGWRTEQQTS
jgi:NodT family efflux transporter outer membrane factor (OMF) lipoprotein